MDQQDFETYKGLTHTQASKNLKSFGYNELTSEANYSWLQLLLSVVKEPMIMLLLCCAAIYFTIGDKTEGIVLLISVLVILGITFYQENKTERTIQALRNLASPRAQVIRNGKLERIAGREVVPEDIVVLEEGDRVPADGLLLKSVNLDVDESALTGESVSVSKIADDKTYLHSGTLVVKGHGIYKVEKTGASTQIGQIGKTIEGIDFKDSLLKLETNSIVKGMSIFALFVCGAVIVSEFLIRKNIIEGLLAGITAAMSMIPEEFPVILTIFLSFGAWKLSKRNVLTRRIPIIETLGAITTLCVDKTGTITENKMKIAKLFANDKVFDVTKSSSEPTSDYHELLEYAYLAGGTNSTDPIEVEIKNAVTKLSDKSRVHNTWTPIKEYAMSSEITAISKVWEDNIQDGKLTVACKGAPESVAELCKLSKEETIKLSEVFEIFANEGLRILGVAKGYINGGLADIPNDQSDIKFEFLGLLAFEDPVKQGVKESVEECYEAGINVEIITGDHASTASTVAEKIGLKNPREALLGTELEKLSNEEISQRLEKINVFARIKPLQKLKLIRALIMQNQIIGMTGDGVNDAPALKEAHVGIAMGKRGTDIAREAAGIVLLDDDFNSIVKGIRQGRKIYSNIKKAMNYVLSIHIPIAGMALLPVVLGYPTFFYPLHILFLEFLIDPIATVVFETERADKTIMKSAPRKLTDRILTKKSLMKNIFNGTLALVASLLIYTFALQSHLENTARTLAFITLVSANLFLVLTNRSEKELIIKSIFEPNKAMWAIFGIAVVALTTIIVAPPLASIFRFGLPHLNDALMAIALGFLAVIVSEVSKVSFKKA